MAEKTLIALAEENCTPFKAGTPPPASEEVVQWRKAIPKWNLVMKSGEPRLEREFSFTGFLEPLAFLTEFAQIAEKQDHHPSAKVEYGRLTLEFWTHSTKGLTRNDFVMAAKADQLYDQQRPRSQPPKKDVVQEADEESFPASDPPAWTLGKDTSKSSK